MDNSALIYRWFFKIIVWVFLGSLYASLAYAAPIVEGALSHSEYRVTVEGGGLLKGETGWLALEIKPNEHWHTYWKNAGDSGASPMVWWKTTGGVTVGQPVYEVPSHIPVGPLMNYGYHGQSTLLFPIEVAESYDGSSLAIAATAEWLVCEVECVPQIVTWELTVPVLFEADLLAESSAVFEQARRKQPETSYWDSDLTISNNNSQLLIFADVKDIPEINEVYFYPVAEGVLEYAANQSWQWTDYGLAVKFVRTEGAMSPDTADGILKLTFTDGSFAAYALKPSLKMNIRGSTSPNTDPLFTMPIWQAALFALLGGLILNLMPCVFPILSLKAFALVSSSFKSDADRKKDGWAYTFGIWISFMAIVGLLLALRSGGAAIGWGFQLQEPKFVGFLAVLMVVVSLSLAGLFNIQFAFQGAGQGLATKEGISGSFFKGVLATLVATPCTAPLMAPAIGFALTQSIPVVLMVFSLLAFGLALPFLALSYSNRLARLMPKPGAWMETVKQGLAFPMLLTAAWLVYIYDVQAGTEATFMLLAAIIALSFGLWLWQQTTQKIARIIAVIAVVVPLGFTYNSSVVQKRSYVSTERSEIEYSAKTLNALLDDGKPVFVYFSAEWCITCKVNERLVLHTDEIRSLMTALNISVVKGDWTNRNAEIAGILAKYGRAGVPLYLYYPAGSREAHVFPEILTKGTITEVLNEL